MVYWLEDQILIKYNLFCGEKVKNAQHLNVVAYESII